MILIDANILLHAYNSSSESHAAARAWLEIIFSKNIPVRLAWMTILAFLRISTNPRVFSNPLSIKQASSIVAGWLSLPHVSPLDPGEQHWSILCDLLEKAQIQGPLVMDAHLAALAIENGATLYSTDLDFTRFNDLQFENPLRS